MLCVRRWSDAGLACRVDVAWLVYCWKPKTGCKRFNSIKKTIHFAHLVILFIYDEETKFNSEQKTCIETGHDGCKKNRNVMLNKKMLFEKRQLPFLPFLRTYASFLLRKSLNTQVTSFRNIWIFFSRQGRLLCHLNWLSLKALIWYQNINAIADNFFVACEHVLRPLKLEVSSLSQSFHWNFKSVLF